MDDPLAHPRRLAHRPTRDVDGDGVVADGERRRRRAATAATTTTTTTSAASAAAGQWHQRAIETRFRRALLLADDLARWILDRDLRRRGGVPLQVIVHHQRLGLVRHFEELVAEQVIVHALRAEAVAGTRLDRKEVRRLVQDRAR